MPLRRISLIVLLVALSIVVQAQSVPTARRGPGAYSTGIPYFVPGGVQTRGITFVVTTTVDDRVVAVCDPSDGLSLREALELCYNVSSDATVFVPSGTYDMDDDIDSNFNNVTIIGEDPATTILHNTRGDDPARDAGRTLSFVIDLGTVTIANLTLRGSDATASSSNLNGGGILVRGQGRVFLENIVVEDNSGESGGGVSLEPTGSMKVTIRDMSVMRNHATAGSGGGLYFSGTVALDSITIQSSIFYGNTATKGGGLYLSGIEDTTIVDTSFSGNSATDMGGGVNFADFAGTFASSAIEDNNAPIGPDCHIESAALFTSNGFNGVTDTSDCPITLSASDQHDNLLDNGGFEEQGKTGKSSAASWDIKKVEGARMCNKPHKNVVAIYGMCAFVFSGNGAISQNVDLTAHVMTGDGEIMTLYARGKSPKATVTFTVTATFSDGTSRIKVKLPWLDNAKPAGQYYRTVSGQIPPLTSPALTKLNLTITKKSGGKFSVDRVYLYVSGHTPRGVLPPPATPAGLRGNN